MTQKLVDAEEIKRAFTWLSKYWDRQSRPEYLHVRTIDEAVSLLDEYRGEAKVIAGGIDVVGLMKNRILSPAALINIKLIPGLNHITAGAHGLSIGALTLINDLERSALIKDKYPILYEAASSIASPGIRNMATIAGNLCQEVRCWYYRRSPVTGISFDCLHKKGEGKCYAVDGENQYHAIIGSGQCVAVCPSDMATALLCLDAKLKTESSDGGRTISIDGLYTPLGNALKPDEIITELQVPHAEHGIRQRFLKFRLRKAIDFAIVSAAVTIKLDNNIIRDARIVLGGVAQVPYRALEAEKIMVGQRLTVSVAAEAARKALANATPLSKNDYKISVAEALVRRAITGE